MEEREVAGAPPQWRPEEDGDYGRRMLGHLLTRNAWLIVLGGLLGGIVFGVISLYQPRVYSSEASLQIDKSVGQAGGAQSAALGPLLGGGPDLTGEIEVLNSRQIIMPVIEVLGLQVDIIDLQAPDSTLRSLRQKMRLDAPLQESWEQLFTRLELREVLVDSDLRKAVTFELIGTESGGWRIGDRSGSAGERAAMGKVSFTPVFGPAHRPGYKYLLVVHPEQETYTNFGKNLSTEIVSNVVRIGYRYHNPVVCARVVNQLIDEYLVRYGVSKGTDYGVVLRFVGDEMGKREARIGEITKELNKYQRESGTYLPSAQGGAAITALAELEHRLALNQIELTNLNNVLSNWERRSPEDIYDSIQSPATSMELEAGMVTTLSAQIWQLQNQRLTKTEIHPDIIALKKGISTKISLIRDALSTNRNSLTLSNASIASQIAQQRGLLRDLPEAENRIFLLTSELKINSDILGRLKQNQIDTQLREASVEREARVLDNAVAPVKKDAPRVGRNAVVGGVTGGVVMALLALLLEALNRRMKSLREVRLGAGIPVLGVLPGPRNGRWVPRERNPQMLKRLAAFLEAPGHVIGIVHLPSSDSSFELAWGISGAVADSTGRHALLIDGDRLDETLC
nr:hypothetical protein [bacterium]